MIILPTGECFSDAAEYIENLVKGDPDICLENYRVVHAICFIDTQPELGWFAHGWVEHGPAVMFGGIIQDGPHAGEKVWITADKQTFYAGMRVQHIRRYTMRELANWNIKTGNLGPWEEPFTSHTRQAKLQHAAKEDNNNANMGHSDPA
jgi:hypothetical protein